MTSFNPYGSFYIRNNLKAALLRFRQKDDDVNIWVDALCIDQENKLEKKAQVSRMHVVYTQAERVCIWLGAGKDKTSETFNFLKEILDLEHLDELVSLPVPNARKWEMIVDLMSNRWFSRRWVIQELALARKASVLWGNEDLEWENFADAIALFMTKYEEIRRTSLDPAGYHPTVDCRALGANTIVHATTNLFRKSSEGHVQQRLLPLEILVSSWLLAFEASEPRDTIFAVLTLAKDSKFANANREEAMEDARIAPDYTKSLFDVYADFIDYCIEKSQSLDILCRYWAPLPKPSVEEALKSGDTGRRVRTKEELKQEMPSWVPFIEKSAFGEPQGVLGGRMNGDSLVGGPERKGQKPYNADGDLRAWVKFGLIEPPKQENKSLSAPQPKRSSTFTTLSKQNGKNDSKADKLRAAQEANNHSRDDNSKDDQLEGSLTRTSTLPAPQRHDGSLTVKGICLDIVAEVSQRVTSTGVIPEDALTMGGWIHNDPPIEDQEVPDKLWRTLVADRGPNGTLAPPWYRRACLECLEHTSRQGDLDIEVLKKKSLPKRTPSMMIAFLERVQQIVFGRRFFRTNGAKKGQEPYFCLGSPEVREGDMVCVLFGCSVPVVLRREQHLGEQLYYKFIGECYVHGMMDGEAIQGKPPGYPYEGRKIQKNNTFVLK